MPCYLMVWRTMGPCALCLALLYVTLLYFFPCCAVCFVLVRFYEPIVMARKTYDRCMGVTCLLQCFQGIECICMCMCEWDGHGNRTAEG